MTKDQIGFACTTINPGAEALEHNIGLWQEQGGGPISVSLDRKSGDASCLGSGLDVVTHDCPPATSYERLCPWDSYSRKNISFTRLARQGVSYIFETDDDNFIYAENIQSRFDQAISFFQSVAALAPAEKSNIFEQIYDVPNNIWARGYPVPWLEQRSESSANATVCSGAGVVQFLVDGNPDVDAIYRLVFGNDIRLETNDFHSSIFSFRNIHPFNSQATLWSREYFALMYLPSFCNFRMTDIWRGYIAQHVLYLQDRCVVYSPPLVMQKRNDHYIYKDFYGEHGGYKEVLRLLELLEKMQLDAGEAPAKLVHQIYSSLVANGFFEQRELVMLESYLEALE